MTKRSVVIGLIFWAGAALAIPAENIPAELLQILTFQQEAWNRQDIEGFMAYYWKSDRLTFQSGANRLHGWNALLERYKMNYSGKDWGELSFTDLEVNVLAPECAYIIGRYRLNIQDALREGLFTIVFKRFPEGWRIIHDQSC
jgi:ketosteroid isomerase-like protein